MNRKLIVPCMLILTGLALSSCGPYQIPTNLPTVEIPNVPSVNAPQIFSTAQAFQPTFTYGGATAAPNSSIPATGSSGTDIQGFLFYGMIALVAVILLILLFLVGRPFFRRPDEPYNGHQDRRGGPPDEP